MKKLDVLGTVGIMVFLVVGSLAMAQAPEGWISYEVEWGDTLSEVAWQMLIETEIQNPVDRIGDVVEMIKAENESIVNPNEIYAWTEIYVPAPEILPKLLAERGFVPEKRAGPMAVLKRENKALREIINKRLGPGWDKILAVFNRFPNIPRLSQEELESLDTVAAVGKFEEHISRLENAKLLYWRLLILAMLILLVFGVIAVTLIKNEAKRRKELKEKTEQEKAKLRQKNAATQEEISGLEKRLTTIKELSPGSTLRRGGQEFVVVAQMSIPSVDIGNPILSIDERAKALGVKVRCEKCKRVVNYVNIARHLDKCTKKVQ